ncbi:MAG: putative sensor protein [Solirubrobacteraceae bacterium]|nr:putative sensor protein [Solirubrobacteraceae bacterium]
MAGETVESEQGVLSAEEALRFLDEASALLTSSLDYERTLGSIAQLMVPRLADWCAVDVVAEDESLRQITSGHPDPEQERLLAELRRRYRQERGASEGVTRVIQTGESELVPDVTGVANARLTINSDETALYERLGPKSYLIVPLIARERTLGAMTLLSTQAGRHYNEADLAFARHLSRRFALAIDNARLYEDAERSRQLLDYLFTTAPVGLGFLDTDLRFVRVNQALADINGATISEHLGRTLTEVVGEPAEGVLPALRGVLETGEPLLDIEISIPGPHGERHLVASYTPVKAGDGQVVGVSGVAIDVTERRRALETERAVAHRSKFMAEASALLDASMDYEELLSNIARLAVPDVADWCAVLLLDEDGVLQQAAVAHADEAKTRWGIELGERYPPVVDPDFGVGKVIATGAPDVTSDISDERLAAVALDDQHLKILKEVGLRSVVTVPLVARGRILGALSFVAAESERRYDDADVALLAELGARAGVAIENARLYTERSRIAHTLQARLLPSRLSAPPGVRLAARYRAAGEFNEVGGDFYDAFQRSPDEWVVVIGDVSGKGPEAAAVTALARYTIRSAALNDWAPAQVLRRLNDTLLHEIESQFITVALAYLSHDGQNTVVRTVLGGHPPPFVVRSDGSVEQIGIPGTLLGVRSDVRLQESQTVLEPGDALLLFTDGVIEAGPRGAPVGEDGLARVLSQLGGADPEAIVSAVDAAALGAGPGRARDDVALLALQALAFDASHGSLELTRPAVAGELRALRDAVVEFASDLPGLKMEEVRLAVGEACANAVVHAYRLASEPGDIHIRALAIGDGLIVEVRDEGCGPVPRNDSPGLGLGLPLMSRLTRELQILDREPHGTLVRLTF